MTINNENTENLFAGTGLATEFETTITAYSASQILVYLREDETDTLQTLTTHYTLAGLGEGDTVTVTMLTAPAADQELVVVRDTDLTQETNLTAARAFDSSVLETRFDLITMMIQEVAKRVARSYKVAVGLTVPDDIISDVDIQDLADYAARAEAAASLAMAPYADRAAAEAADVDPAVDTIRVQYGRYVLSYSRDASGTALTTGDGATWSPADQMVFPEHFEENTTPGTTDMTAALTAALAFAGQVFLIANLYVSSTIALPAYGDKLIGIDDVVISSAATTGPAIWLQAGRQQLKNIILNAVGTRASASAVAISKPGVKIGGDGRSGQATGGILENVTVQYHPGAGILNTLAGPNLDIVRCACNYNWGSGYFSDDGTAEAASTQRNGIITLHNFRAQENGGNGIQLAPSGNTSYRYRIIEYEGISNAWDYVAQSLTNAEADIRGQNIYFAQCGFGDTYYDQTTTQGGTSRVAKGAMSMGINFGSGCVDVGDDFCRFVTTGINATLTSVDGYRSRGAYVEATKTSGWVVGAGCSDIYVEITDSNDYTTMLTATPNGVRGRVDGYEARWTGAYATLQGKVDSGTVASASLNCTAEIMNVAGEGGVADTLAALARAGGSVLHQAGQKIVILNKQAYNITCKHSTGGSENMFNKTAANVVLSQNKAITYVCDGTNYFEI